MFRVVKTQECFLVNIGWNKSNKSSDEGGKAIKGNQIFFIEQGGYGDTQADWFAPNTASGLTQAGLSRINQSIEAFVYCILGAQVNVRSSILGSGGRAKEAQSEFLVPMEDAITPERPTWPRACKGTSSRLIKRW